MIDTCRRCEGTGREPDHTAVGLTARKRREQAGLSLREVAWAMGISPAYLCDLEHGRRNWRAHLVAVNTEAIRLLSPAPASKQEDN